MEQRIGVIGVDRLTAHMVEGLFHGGGRPGVTLGPREREWCAHLSRGRSLRSARTDQGVIDDCDVLLFRVAAEELLHRSSALRFRDDQLVLGIGMNVTQRRLARAVHPAHAVRVATLTAVAVGEGAVCLYPADRGAERVLETLGEVHHLREESQFEACEAVFAGYQWLLTLSAETDRWLRTQGLAEPVASALSARLSRAAGSMASSRRDSAEEQAAGLAEDNPRAALGASVLQRGGVFDDWRRALDVVLAARERSVDSEA